MRGSTVDERIKSRPKFIIEHRNMGLNNSWNHLLRCASPEPRMLGRFPELGPFNPNLTKSNRNQISSII